MQYFYINLDREQARAQHVEQQFSTCSQQRLQRFAAIDTTWIAQHAIAGQIRPVEKACYMSHLTLLKAQLNTSAPICIFEDDVSFFPETEQIIQAAIAAAANTPWDILFTNVCIPDPHAMLDLFMLHRQLHASQGLQLLPLHNLNFAGSAGYIVNPNALPKLCQHLEQARLDLPYDLALRELAHSGQIHSFAIFPFATGLSSYANQSQIQEGADLTDLAWNTIRGLLSWKVETPALLHALGALPPSYMDAESEAFSRALGVMLSKNFQIK
jgi:GR25 family glycosyltransferase involved in LPS biosynthesis